MIFAFVTHPVLKQAEERLESFSTPMITYMSIDITQNKDVRLTSHDHVDPGILFPIVSRVNTYIDDDRQWSTLES